MKRIITPVGILEHGISSPFGSQARFITNNGITYDMPEWLVGLLLIGAIGGTAFITWKVAEIFNIGKTATGIVGKVLQIGSKLMK